METARTDERTARQRYWLEQVQACESSARRLRSTRRYEVFRPGDDALPQVPPTTATGKGLNNPHNEWSNLVCYLEDGRLEIDNNGAVNAIRLFVVGRKNWMFSHSVKGVNASATLYSLIESAKANDLESCADLRRSTVTG